MSTVPITCPNPKCKVWIRVAVQPSSIMITHQGQQLHVKFDDQHVAHICQEK